MRISFKIQLYSWLVTVILGISFLWQLLEYLIYGEIQPRIVDDIVGLTYVIAILYAYKMGRSHEREAQRNYKHIENYWRQLISELAEINFTNLFQKTKTQISSCGTEQERKLNV